MKIKSLFLLPLLLAGCDSTEVESKKELSIQVERISCNYFGYCSGCGIGVDGKFSCGFTFNSNCSGYQDARTKRYQEIYHWKSDPSVKYTRNYTVILDRLSMCQ